MHTHTQKHIYARLSIDRHLIQSLHASLRLSATRLFASAAPGGLPAPSVPLALIVILVAVAAGGNVATSGTGPGVFRGGGGGRQRGARGPLIGGQRSGRSLSRRRAQPLQLLALGALTLSLCS